MLIVRDEIPESCGSGLADLLNGSASQGFEKGLSDCLTPIPALKPP